MFYHTVLAKWAAFSDKSNLSGARDTTRPACCSPVGCAETIGVAVGVNREGYREILGVAAVRTKADDPS